jgi:hypothetical protein
VRLSGVHGNGNKWDASFFNGDQLVNGDQVIRELSPHRHCFGGVFAPLEQSALDGVANARGFNHTTWVLASVAVRLGLRDRGAAPSATLGSGAGYFNVAELAEGHVLPAAVVVPTVSQAEQSGLDAVRESRGFPAAGCWHRAGLLQGSEAKPGEAAVAPSACHASSFFHEKQLVPLETVHLKAGKTPCNDRLQRLLEHAAKVHGFTSVAWFTAHRAEQCGAVVPGETPAVALSTKKADTQWYNGDQMLPAPPAPHTTVRGHTFDADHQILLEHILQARGFTSRVWRAAPCRAVRRGEVPAAELWSGTDAATKFFNANQLQEDSGVASGCAQM